MGRLRLASEGPVTQRRDPGRAFREISAPAHLPNSALGYSRSIDAGPHKTSSWQSACRSDQNSSSPVPVSAPARPFERPLNGTPHARRATRIRSRRSCCARPALSSRNRLSDDCWRHAVVLSRTTHHLVAILLLVAADEALALSQTPARGSWLGSRGPGNC